MADPAQHNSDSLTRRIKIFFRLIYEKLILINDSPQKVAIGFGLGVFLGILPATGPLAALVLSVILRVNRIAAITGSLLTNTWLSLVTFVLAIKIGSAVTGSPWEQIQASYRALIKNFHWKDLFDASVLTILEPLIIGYLIISLAAGLLAYLILIIILTQRKKYRQKHPPK